jgi:hypothetical protein
VRKRKKIAGFGGRTANCKALFIIAFLTYL